MKLEGLENVEEVIAEEEELDYIDGTEHMVSSNILVIAIYGRMQDNNQIFRLWRTRVLLVIPLRMMVGPKLLFNNKLCSFASDAHKGNPFPLLGASTTTEGVLRGKAGGNVFNMADAEKPINTGLGALFGKIFIYKSGDDPSSVKPQMVLKTEVDNHMASVLTEVGELYTPPRSK